MSWTLRYDGADLHRAAAMLDQAVEVARRIDEDAGRMAGQVADCGHRRLASAVEDFLEGWAHGMGVVAEDAGGLGRALHEAARSYEQVETTIGDAMRTGR